MAMIEIDMDVVNEEASYEVAEELMLHFKLLEDDGVRIIDMIVALGYVMGVLIDKNNGHMAHTRSH